MADGRRRRGGAAARGESDQRGAGRKRQLASHRKTAPSSTLKASSVHNEPHREATDRIDGTMTPPLPSSVVGPSLLVSSRGEAAVQPPPSRTTMIANHTSPPVLSPAPALPSVTTSPEKSAPVSMSAESGDKAALLKLRLERLKGGDRSG